MRAIHRGPTAVQDDEHSEWLRGATSIADGPEMPWGWGDRAARALLRWSGVAPVVLAIGLATTVPPLDMSEVVTVTDRVVQHREREADPAALEDTVGVMPPKSIVTIRMRIEHVRKALPPIVDPVDA